MRKRSTALFAALIGFSLSLPVCEAQNNSPEFQSAFQSALESFRLEARLKVCSELLKPASQQDLPNVSWLSTPGITHLLITEISDHGQSPTLRKLAFLECHKPNGTISFLKETVFPFLAEEEVQTLSAPEKFLIWSEFFNATNEGSEDTWQWSFTRGEDHSYRLTGFWKSVVIAPDGKVYFDLTRKMPEISNPGAPINYSILTPFDKDHQKRQ